MFLNKDFTKTLFSLTIGKGETGWGTLCKGFLWPRCPRPATPGPKQSSTGCSGDWTAHDGCQGQEERETHLHFTLQPNVVLVGEELQGQPLLDVLQVLGHGVDTLHLLQYTVQLSTGYQPCGGLRNWFSGLC